jgi:hypothetical protein
MRAFTSTQFEYYNIDMVAKFSLAKLMNGPSGVDNMEAYQGK